MLGIVIATPASHRTSVEVDRYSVIATPSDIPKGSAMSNVWITSSTCSIVAMTSSTQLSATKPRYEIGRGSETGYISLA
ncbi:hypothetical protein [Halalkalicoccus salilacus]|uniref:hypothetical protein n=1 Tax=Halalkalicoccus sp. GCM10025704 TaxID=3252662 RepID=UPI0036F2E6DC